MNKTNSPSQTLTQVLAGLMRRYRERVPDVQRIEQAMLEAGLIHDLNEIENDHIAFRTLGVPHLGIQSLEKIFLQCGYQRRDRYDFTQKKLNAYWYAPPFATAPRIFISELRVGELSPPAQAIVHRYTDTVTRDPVSTLDLADGLAIDQFLHQPLWRTPTWEDYQTLNRESEYAGWVIYNRYYLNHFTIAVHNLPAPFDTVACFNDFLESLGVRLNDSGGKCKVSPDGLLIQSSTVAQMVTADFDNGRGGYEQHDISGSYVEFAERRPLPEFATWPKAQLRREHRREGFEAGNADRIFESTYSQQTRGRAAAGSRVTALLDKLRIAAVNPGACCGPEAWLDDPHGQLLPSVNPSNGEPLAAVRLATVDTYRRVAAAAAAAFQSWRERPAPLRGQVVRDLGARLREFHEPLGEMVTLEMGKIRSEGLGEVQEMIDICDFAVGLSRQLYGNTMHSERPGHRMSEQWHPLGPVGIISAFNFPVAVWSWNAAIAAVCGDTLVWKPSPQTPLVAIAVQHLCNQVLADHGLTGIFNLVIGADPDVPRALVDDPQLPLVSFTGSTPVGREVAQRVAGRLGRYLLELGGNNALIVEPDSDLDLAVRAILFGAVGTAGQRCTTTRRLLVHRQVADAVCTRLVQAYRQVRIGDPLEPDTLMGPLISPAAVRRYQETIAQAVGEGGRILCGGQVRSDRPGYFVEPTIIRMPAQTAQMHQETFAPILYVLEYDQLQQAIAWQNDVPQGLSSALFTQNLLAAERFLSVAGSDCGIANVNLGTSGAEIGGAFGGEKETGGGREAGSDAWKAYMRRQTNTVNWSGALPLAQGIEFGDFA